MTALPRLPSLFVSHGGGPCFWISLPEPFGPHAFDGLKSYLNGLVATLPIRPSAFLVVSGHWEEDLPTIGAAPHPGMIYDYFGFPKHTYELSYPAPGSPQVAERVAELFQQAGIDHRIDADRGFDHGVFVPFLMIDPDAHIPVVTLSIRRDLDPAAHIAMGKALAPLRDEGVLIVGSGNSYHNLSAFRDGEPAASEVFDAWLTSAVVDTAEAHRSEQLIAWSKAPAARLSHPREEHLIPLMVAAGAGAGDMGSRVFHESIGRKMISGFAFG